MEQPQQLPPLLTALTPGQQLAAEALTGMAIAYAIWFLLGAPGLGAGAVELGGED